MLLSYKLLDIVFFIKGFGIKFCKSFLNLGLFVEFLILDFFIKYGDNKVGNVVVFDVWLMLLDR